MDINEVITKYLNRGFGSMNKNDFEVWIFGQILKMDNYKGKSNYELSIALRIPESKVKRLRYEAALSNLRNIQGEPDYKREIITLLENAKLRNDGKKIIFQVEDVLLKSYISSILKKEGRILDSSFNPELVVINVDDFESLVKEIYGEKDIDEILKEAQKLTKDPSKKIQFKEVMGWVVTGAVEGVTSGITSSVITNLTPTGIINTITKVLK